jgi:RNA polymerase-binding transcription factor DksA
MRKSKRSVRHQILVELLKHLKSYYNFELAPDVIRGLLYSNAGIAALLSFRSDSHLSDLQGALARLASDTFGICIGCKQLIAQSQLENEITRRVCPSCEEEFNRRRPRRVVPAASAREK